MLENKVMQRFLRYVQIDTQSSETSQTFPSTAKQKVFGKMLAEELKEMQVEDVYFDSEYGYVYGTIPASKDQSQKPAIAMLAHMDTSPETSGEGVKPHVIYDYDGQDIVLQEGTQMVLSPQQFPELADYKGKTLVVTDGTTLLGADDKAGIAEIMTLAEVLMENLDLSHRELRIVFTPDEEIGAGVDHIDLQRVNAEAAYTVDGGELGELEYENFNAASAKVTIQGITVHPGEAKNKMIQANLIAMEFEQALPALEKPQYTEKYEGFYYLTKMEGNTAHATLHYLLRDHSREKFEERKNTMYAIARQCNEKYGSNTVSVEIEDSYYNMKEIIMPAHADLITIAQKAMEAEGVTPIIQPIRGGTDGARLSFMGLPCPNICTGGHNYHGEYEYCCVESMAKIVKILQNIVTLL